LYTAIYLLITIPIASVRVLWNDELYTLTVSSGRFGEMFRLLTTGADAITPGFAALSHLVLSLWGIHELALRAPAILGFWVMAVCLFEITAARTSLVYGAIAMFLPFLTTTFLYAYEARPYGVLLGFTGLALLLWQRAGGDRPRRMAIFGFALALTGAAAAHYYAIFIVIPFAVAEALHWLRRGGFRLAIWFSLALPVLPTIPALPLLRNAGRIAHAFWSHARWMSISYTYFELVGEFLILAFLIAALAGLLLLWRAGQPAVLPRQTWSPPEHEIIAVTLLAALPFIVVPIAKVTTHAFVGRYAIEAIPAICILAVWGLYAFTAQRPWVPLLLLLMLVTGASFQNLLNYRTLAAERMELQNLGAYLAKAQPASLPILIPDAGMFLELHHYGTPALANRLVYLADIAKAIQYSGSDTVDYGTIVIGPAAGARIDEMDSFFKSTPQFLIYGFPSGRWGWSVPELVERHVVLQVVATYDGRLMFRAQSPRP
jgi:hypothetical protein